ncbi:ABC transporter ATP-binding protein [Clostridiaceae bacterium 35-E11]
MEISICNLVKDYETRRVVDIENLKIKKGSFLGIIGPNGAGKSTLVRMLGGLEEPTKGQILYNGKINPVYRDITVVFQKPYLLRTTVFHNIAYPLIIRKENKKEITKKVNVVLEEMELHDLKDKKSWNLSGGEMQKVALARALIFKPSLLILDEPTANIDPSSMAIMEKMVQKINEREKTTVIMITHNLQQARRICKEVVFMHQGKVKEVGVMEQVIFHPKDSAVKKFIEGELLM